MIHLTNLEEFVLHDLIYRCSTELRWLAYNTNLRNCTNSNKPIIHIENLFIINFSRCNHHYLLILIVGKYNSHICIYTFCYRSIRRAINFTGCFDRHSLDEWVDDSFPSNSLDNTTYRPYVRLTSF